MTDQFAIQPSLETGAVDALNPPKVLTAQRAPVATNSADTNQKDGTLWLNQNAQSAYIKVETANAQGVWVALGGATVDVRTLTGDSGGAISPSGGTITLAGGTGVSTSGSGSTITFNVTGGGLETTEVTGTSVSMAVNRRYVLNNAGLVTATLPATAAVGDMVQVTGKGAGGWRVAQNAGDIIHFNNNDTTTGVGGRLDSTNRYDTVTLVCTVANDEWTVEASMGVITVT